MYFSKRHPHLGTYLSFFLFFCGFLVGGGGGARIRNDITENKIGPERSRRSPTGKQWKGSKRTAKTARMKELLLIWCNIPHMISLPTQQR